MVKFKVGDIVKPNPKAWLLDRKIAESIVEAVVRKSSPYTFSVEVTKVKESGKQYLNQEIICRTGYDGFELVKRGACKRELHITTDGTTTHAVLKEGGKVVKRAKAVCSPDDEYSFETGARLAVDRVFGKDEKNAEEKGAAYEPKPKFNIGNMVKVVDSRKTYTLYDDIMQQYGADYLMRWAYGVTAPQDGEYRVVQKTKHPNFRAMLYVIERQDAYAHTLYIIGEEGLAKAW